MADTLEPPAPPAGRPDGPPVRRRPSLRHIYGAGPVHLVALLACFAFTGYLASLVAQSNAAKHIGAYFIGSVIVHDLILWPTYTVADRLLVEAYERHRSSRRPPRVAWVNYVRFPVVISAVLLAISFPLVFSLSPRVYHADTTLTTAPFANRYLAVAAGLCVLSALTYASRVAWVVWRGRPAPARSSSAG
jgi:hypothetical protein